MQLSQHVTGRGIELGYLDRANDPPPGIIVMWRGLDRLIDLATGYSIANAKFG